MTKSKSAEGTIFSVPGRDSFGTPSELLEHIGQWQDELSRWVIDADDPIEFLAKIEETPLAIIREHETAGEKNSHVRGVRASHLFALPLDRPAILQDAWEEIIELGKLAHGLQTRPSEGHLLIHAIKAGFHLAVIRARRFEQATKLGLDTPARLIPFQQGTPITDKARKLLRQGVSIRKVADACGVKKGVVETWKKNLKKS